MHPYCKMEEEVFRMNVPVMYRSRNAGQIKFLLLCLEPLATTTSFSVVGTWWNIR